MNSFEKIKIADRIINDSISEIKEDNPQSDFGTCFINPARYGIEKNDLNAIARIIETRQGVQDVDIMETFETLLIVSIWI